MNSFESELDVEYMPLSSHHETFSIEKECKVESIDTENSFEWIKSIFNRRFLPNSVHISNLEEEKETWEPPFDLDKFFKQIYYYHCRKGFYCIVFEWILEMLTFLCVILLSILLFLAIDWQTLMNTKCKVDSKLEEEDSKKKECDILDFAFHSNPFFPLTPYRFLVMLHLFWVSIYLLFLLVSFVFRMQDVLDIRNFVNQRLKIDDYKMQTMKWSHFLNAVIEYQDVQTICVRKRLSVHDALMRMMRKENFLIAMVNEKLLHVAVPDWFPGTYSVSTDAVGKNDGKNKGEKESDNSQEREILTKSLEWALRWGVLNFMFEKNFLIRREFVSDARFLRRRLQSMSVFLLLFSPFLFFFLLSFFLFQNAEKLYKDPSSANFREYSNLAKWKFREFNEVEHLVEERLDSSCADSVVYLKQFSSPLLSLTCKFFSFLFGSMSALFLLLALLDESLLESHLFGRNLLFYGAIFGSALALSRSMAAGESKQAMALVRAEEHMRNISFFLRFCPPSWKEEANAENVRKQFANLFKSKLNLFLEEIISIFTTPYILFFCYAKNAERIVRFVQECSADVEGVGHVCSFSVFDFEKHGNFEFENQNQIQNQIQNRNQNQNPSSHFKMEKSFLSLLKTYSSFQPNKSGKRFLKRMAKTIQLEKDKQVQKWQKCQKSFPSRPSTDFLKSVETFLDSKDNPPSDSHFLQKHPQGFKNYKNGQNVSRGFLSHFTENEAAFLDESETFLDKYQTYLWAIDTDDVDSSDADLTRRRKSSGELTFENIKDGDFLSKSNDCHADRSPNFDSNLNSNLNLNSILNLDVGKMHMQDRNHEFELGNSQTDQIQILRKNRGQSQKYTSFCSEDYVRVNDMDALDRRIGNPFLDTSKNIFPEGSFHYRDEKRFPPQYSSNCFPKKESYGHGIDDFCIKEFESREGEGERRGSRHQRRRMEKRRIPSFSDHGGFDSEKINGRDSFNNSTILSDTQFIDYENKHLENSFVSMGDPVHPASKPNYVGKHNLDNVPSQHYAFCDSETLWNAMENHQRNRMNGVDRIDLYRQMESDEKKEEDGGSSHVSASSLPFADLYLNLEEIEHERM